MSEILPCPHCHKSCCLTSSGGNEPESWWVQCAQRFSDGCGYRGPTINWGIGAVEAHNLICRPSSGEQRPVAWMVERDTDYESREFFLSEEAARQNACLGVVTTYLRPLFTIPPPSPSQDAIMGAAREIQKWMYRNDGITDWDEETEEFSPSKDREEIAAIISQHMQIPEGWVLVPNEPTPAMLVKGFMVTEAAEDPGGVYRAMLAAAPPKGEETEGNLGEGLF